MDRVFSCVYGVLKYITPVPRRGVACYARTSAQRAAFSPNGRNEKIPIKPRPLAGWGILAHGETMGHGAPRQQTLRLLG